MYKNKKQDQQNKFNIFNLPKRLFKYYSYNSLLNVKRLLGDVYLASPYDFNDPCDCRREVINNSKDRVNIKNIDWLKRKMKELDFNENESDELANSLLQDDKDVKFIHRRMLERLGILCLTTTQSDSLMWGYYANNDGICIEYDTSKIVRSIVIGYINMMSYTTTKFLYDDEEYKEGPEIRTPSLSKQDMDSASEIIRTTELKQISNRFLNEQDNEQNILNFARNIFLKRVYAKSIIYNVEPDGSPAPLFFDRGHASSETKYFKKTKTWKHENEFRFIISLGGRMPISLGKECIKNVYLGCNMSNERIAAIALLMVKHNLHVGLYKMRRLKNCGLAPQNIKLDNYKSNIESFEKELVQMFPED